MTISHFNPDDFFLCTDQSRPCSMLKIRCVERQKKAQKMLPFNILPFSFKQCENCAKGKAIAASLENGNQQTKQGQGCIPDQEPIPLHGQNRPGPIPGEIKANPIKNQPELEKEANEMGEPGTYKTGTAKECSKCGIPKPLTEENWHRNKDSRDGFAGVCKKCKNSMGAASYKRRMAERNAIKKKTLNEILAAGGKAKEVFKPPKPIKQKAEDWMPDEKDRDLTGLFLSIGNKDIMAWLKKEADAELRTPEMQALWIIRQHLKVREMKNGENAS